MSHICNKCQQWRPLWRRAPLNDSEVFANVALTDIEITQRQYPFQPLTGIVGTLVLIIGWEYFDTEHRRTVKNTEVIIDISTSRIKTESSCFLSAQSSVSAGWVTSSLSQRPEARAGIRKHRVRSVCYQPHILYAMRRHKHPDKEAQVSHNHQKAIFERRKKRRRKTNMSSAGGRGRVDESAES